MRRVILISAGSSALVSSLVTVLVLSVVSEKEALGGFRVSDILPKPIAGPAILAALERAGVSPQGSAGAPIDTGHRSGPSSISLEMPPAREDAATARVRAKG